MRSIAADLSVPFKNIKDRLCPGSKKQNENDSLNEPLRKSCSQLLKEITDTIGYYDTYENDKSIDKVYICGGFALVNNMPDLLNDTLSKQVLLWNPLETISCHVNTDNYNQIVKEGPSLAVALGLAMRSI